MKKLVFALVVVAALGASAEKFGTVDMLKLVRNHSSYDGNKALLTETQKDYEKKLDRIKSEVEALAEEGKKLNEQIQQPMLSANARTKLQKDLRDIEMKYMAGQQRMRSEAMRSQQDLQELEARLLKTVGSDIRKKIAAFAKKEGYDYVLDASAVPYFSSKYDLTPLVLKSMGVDPATAVDPEKDVKAKKNEGK